MWSGRNVAQNQAEAKKNWPSTPDVSSVSREDQEERKLGDRARREGEQMRWEERGEEARRGERKEDRI